MKNIFNIYFWKNIKTNISCFFFPRQRWLTKKIPNQWCDKVELIRLVLFECLVDYVEGEKCFERLSWDDEEYKQYGIRGEYIFKEKEKLKGIIVNAYNYIKIERPKLEKDLDASYPKPIAASFVESNGKTIWASCEAQYGMSFEDAYRETLRLEKLIDELDQKYLHDIVEIRQTLWT